MPTIARALLLACIALATLEVCARIHDRMTLGLPILQFQYQAPAFYAYDATGPHGLPYARDGKYAMNSLGFRGPEAVPGRFTVLCLGASETFGVTETEGKEYPRQLEQKLNTAGTRHYQVVNAAIPGERLEDIAATLPATLLAVHPMYAVIYPTTGMVAWTSEAWNRMHPTPASKNPPPERYSRLRFRNHLVAALRQASPDWIQAWQNRRDVAKAEAVLHSRPTSHLPEHNIAEFRNVLESVVRNLQAHGIRPILVTHATRFGPDGRYRDTVLMTFETYYPVLTAAGLFDADHRMNEVIRTLGRDYHAPVVDAARLLSPGPANFADFFHFTDEGSSHMALLLASRIESR